MNRPAAALVRVWKRVPPVGYLTLAAFLICVVSGVMLALVYRPEAALDSLALVMMKNPVGVFVRSLHYWSAQAFLVLALWHVADYLAKRGETSVAFGVWLRLALTVPVIVYAMLSGFILRADIEGRQAGQIFEHLLQLVPLVGGFLSRTFTGSGSHLFVVYLHHICTATIIIWLTTIEHARRIVPGPRFLLYVLAPLAVVSLVAVPGLVAYAGAVEKGPWYLVGLQEILYWMPDGRPVVWAGLAALVVWAVLPKLASRSRSFVRRGIFAGIAVYALLTMIGLFFRGAGWRWSWPTQEIAGVSGFHSVAAYRGIADDLVVAEVPLINGRRESCLACHQVMSGFATAHDPATIGCTSCHLGNPFALDAAQAHAGMSLTPANLSIVEQTCATANCHGDIAPRVRASLMNTMSGVVAVDRVVFGESDDLDHPRDVAALTMSPADTHLRHLCASCHIGVDKSAPAALTESSRGGGCAACHLRYDPPALEEMEARGRAGRQLARLQHHPGIDVNVPAVACFGCHSRSGRISTNYEGWHETQLDEAVARGMPGWPEKFRTLEDGRVFERQPADVHFEKGMTCIDCHTATEVMGDGIAHAHEEAAIRISCRDCHDDKPPATAEFADLDAETQKIVALRQQNEPGGQFVRLAYGTGAYPSVFVDSSGAVTLVTKTNGATLRPKPLVAACSRDISGHERMECRSCHSAWAPQCITCHTSFDPTTAGWDLLADRSTRGTWEERAAHLLADPPVLGIEETSNAEGRPEERIATFVPGMVMTLNRTMHGAKLADEFHRLYAPLSPHTIVSQARDCRSCHNNPLALGYGRGTLTYDVANGRGTWRFEPAFARNAADGLPLDAWIGFLQEPTSRAATRNNVRPFNLAEQRRMLLVGACLDCHDEHDPPVVAAFTDFAHYRERIRPACMLPAESE